MFCNHNIETVFILLPDMVPVGEVLLSTSPQMDDLVHSHFAGMLCVVVSITSKSPHINFVVTQVFCMFCHFGAVFVYTFAKF